MNDYLNLVCVVFVVVVVVRPSVRPSFRPSCVRRRRPSFGLVNYTTVMLRSFPNKYKREMLLLSPGWMPLLLNEDGEESPA